MNSQPTPVPAFNSPSIVVTREPTHEGATMTKDAIREEKDNQARQMESTVSTPGYEVPGAFPRTTTTGVAQTNGVAQIDVEYIKDAALSALNVVKTYGKAVEEKIGESLPPSVAAYFPISHANANNSASVLAPHERPPASDLQTHGRSFGDFDASPTPNSAHTYLHPTFTVGNSVHDDDKTPEHSGNHDHDHISANSQQASINASTRTLAGSRVDTPPELETLREQEQVNSVSASSRSRETREDNTSSCDAQNLNTDTINANKLPNTSPRTHPLEGNGAEWKHSGSLIGASVPQDAGETAPPSAKQFDSDVATAGHGFPESRFKEETTTPTTEEMRDTSQAAGGNDMGTPSEVQPAMTPSGSAILSDKGQRRKSGFMDKLKGEVKFLSGKLSHKEAKIEEGRKLMGKN